jgi:hypothetical protein
VSDPATGDEGSWYERSPDVLERDVDEEVVLAAPGGKDVSVVSASAGRVWRLLETPRTFVDLVTSLAREYERPVESLAFDIDRVLQELIHRGLMANVADGDD